MEIVYKKLTEEELDTFVDMRIRQLTEEYTTEGREVPENVDLKSALFGYYRKHLSDGTFVSWLAMDGNAIVGTSGMSFVEKPPYGQAGPCQHSDQTKNRHLPCLWRACTFFGRKHRSSPCGGKRARIRGTYPPKI